MKNEHCRKYLIFTLFCTAIYFPLFLHLDWQPINNWDESLFAIQPHTVFGEVLRTCDRGERA